MSLACVNPVLYMSTILTHCAFHVQKLQVKLQALHMQTTNYLSVCEVVRRQLFELGLSPLLALGHHGSLKQTVNS